jgi:hypothetical protein
MTTARGATVPSIRRLTAAALASAALALVVSGCTTPGVNDLYMPPTSEDPYVVPSSTDPPSVMPSVPKAVDLDGTAVRSFLEQNDLRGLPLADARRQVEEAGLSVRFDSSDGSKSTVEPPADSRVVSQYVLTQESYPPSHFVILVVATNP